MNGPDVIPVKVGATAGQNLKSINFKLTVRIHMVLENPEKGNDVLFLDFQNKFDKVQFQITIYL